MVCTSEDRIQHCYRRTHDNVVDASSSDNEELLSHTGSDLSSDDDSEEEDHDGQVHLFSKPQQVVHPFVPTHDFQYHDEQQQYDEHQHQQCFYQDPKALAVNDADSVSNASSLFNASPPLLRVRVWVGNFITGL